MLSIFRKLHRTRQMIFGGDKYALTEARKKINSEFKNRTALADPAEIEKVRSPFYTAHHRIQVWNRHRKHTLGQFIRTINRRAIKDRLMMGHVCSIPTMQFLPGILWEIRSVSLSLDWSQKETKKSHFEIRINMPNLIWL